MEKKEPKYYILWFFAAVTWTATFILNLTNGGEIDWVVILQFCNIFLSFGAGIINRKRYKERNK